MPTCTATRISGRPCSARARPNRPYCFAHDPDLQLRRAAARQAGGYGKSTVRRTARRMPATLKPVLNHLYTTLAALAAGECDARSATAMAAVASAIARLYDQADTTQRLQALEDATAAQQRRAEALP